MRRRLGLVRLVRYRRYDQYHHEGTDAQLCQIAHSLTMIGGSRPDNNTTVNASLVTDDHKAGIYLFGQGRHRASYDHDGDGYSELGKLEAKTLGFRSYLRPATTPSSLSSTITSASSGEVVIYWIFRLTRRISPSRPTTRSTGRPEFDLFSRDYHHRLNVYTSAQHTKRQSYYGAGKDPTPMVTRRT